ncbi:class I SAM-dependent methyltransferase [Agromyces sp. SYSU T00194]|uniref:class I SAM-dependent methyltransferase n=1 Tax=Agromyces chitinivorans TaxID=3158560 RepID=UPI0033979085
MLPDLRWRATDASERMEDPDGDPVALERTYRRFGIVNAIVSGWRAIYRTRLRPRLRADRVTTLLDVGTGGGDLPRALLAWARRDGLALAVTAIDPDVRAIRWGLRQPAVPGLALRRAHSSDLVRIGERYDLVVSNHVLHHLDGAELGGLLADSERLLRPGGLALHADIARSRWGYAGFGICTLPFQPNLLAGSYIREDGLTSIRRSHTVAELAPALPAGWRVRAGFPSRLEAWWERP